MPNFEVLDARIASALHKIIHNSHFKKESVWRNTRQRSRTVFFRGRQIDYLNYDYFRVTGVQYSFENYADLFTIVLRNDDIQEFDSKWDGKLLFMTKIPLDDILKGFYKLRIRECDKLQTVLELYDLETHQKKLGPDYHRLKAMVKRSIEQEIRNQNFGARSGNFEKNAVVKNQGTKQRVQRILGDCWQWETNGQCVKGNNCSFRHDMNSVGKVHHQIRLRILSCSRVSENHRGPEVPEVKVRVVECRDGLARITLEELAITHSVKDGILQNACSTKTRMVAVSERSAHSHIVRLRHSRRNGPNRIMTKVLWLYCKRMIGRNEDSLPTEVTINQGNLIRGVIKLERKSSQRRLSDARPLGCVFQDMTPPKSLLRKSTDMPKPIQRVKFEKAIARHT